LAEGAGQVKMALCARLTFKTAVSSLSKAGKADDLQEPDKELPSFVQKMIFRAS
jgi:hypothetical protein